MVGIWGLQKKKGKYEGRMERKTIADGLEQNVETSHKSGKKRKS